MSEIGKDPDYTNVPTDSLLKFIEHSAKETIFWQRALADAVLAKDRATSMVAEWQGIWEAQIRVLDERQGGAW